MCFAALSDRTHSERSEGATSEAEMDSTSSLPPDVAAPPPASAAAPLFLSACADKPHSPVRLLMRDTLVQKTDNTHPKVLPLDLLLGRPVVHNQFVIALLQLSGRHV